MTAPRPCTTASLRPMSAACVRTFVSEVGFGVENDTWTPPRKSMPRLRPRVVSDAVRYIAYEEGRDALIASFGDRGKPTAEEARQLDEDWGVSAKNSGQN